VITLINMPQLERKDFVETFDMVSRAAFRIARERGYMDHPEPYLILDMIHHVECELKELLDVFARQRRFACSDKIRAFSQSEEEWADCMIKLMRVGAQYNFRPAAILAKLDYESTREPQNGGKIF
jgi:hypothetical protein